MDVKKVVLILLILLGMLVFVTVLVASQRPQMHKSFQLEQIIYKRAK